MSRISVFVACLLGAIMVNRARADNPIAESLHAVITRQTNHARQWLEAKDYKSLGQSAGGLELLALVLQARSDDHAWQAAAGQLASAARELQAAAARSHADAAAALEKVEAAGRSATRIQPAGTPLSAPRANVRALMLLMDGIYADAKIALIADQPQTAKNQAYVLSELGRVVSNSRNSAGWSAMSEEFSAAALAAARSPSNDSSEVRRLLRTMYERCTDCHDSR